MTCIGRGEVPMVRFTEADKSIPDMFHGWKSQAIYAHGDLVLWMLVWY